MVPLLRILERSVSLFLALLTSCSEVGSAVILHVLGFADGGRPVCALLLIVGPRLLLQYVIQLWPF